MENNNIQIITAESDIDEGVGVSLKDLFTKCLSNWYWFAISAILCLGMACLYILRTPPRYTRTATVLIKEAGTKKSSANDLETLLATGVGQVSSKVVNEVIAFQSPALMLDVVERLGLSTNYSVKGLFRSDIIYGNKVPVEVKFLDIPSNYRASFNVSPFDGGCEISNFTYSQKADEKISIGKTALKFGDTLVTKAGRIVIHPNLFFEGQWTKTIRVGKVSDIVASTSLQKGLKAESVDVKNRSDVLKISFTDKSVQRADDVINTLIAIYNENWVADRNKMAVSTTNFINDRLVSLEAELGDVDQDISSYKSSNLIPDVTAVSSLYMEQTKETGKYIQDVDNQLYVYKYIKAYLSDNPGTTQLIPMAGSISNSGISTQILEYNKMILNRNGILANSSDKNPLVKDLESALTSTRYAIEASISNQIGTLEDQLGYLRSRENQNKSRIAASPTQTQYLTTVGRQQKVKESLYLFLLQKREENELSQAFTAYNTRIITPPMGIARPSAPKTKKIMLMALLIGLCLPFAIIYVTLLADTKIRSRKDVEGLSMPFLGEIPMKQSAKKAILRKKNRHSDIGAAIVVKEGERDVINEAFRVLRTNIEFIGRGTKCPVLLTTSFNPGSGKTFITMNVAISLAIKGLKVLAIDGDLRSSALSQYVDAPHSGLSDYLSGQSNGWKDVIAKFPQRDNLHVIPVGSVPPNPSELIANDRFKKLIEAAKQEYDIVLIDCPPVDIVADTQIIEEYVDRCMFVVRAGLLERQMLPVLEKMSSDKKLKNLSAILNGTEAAGAYYGRYGYHSYGYGNGYGYHQKA